MTIANIDFETYSEAGFVWDAARNKWAALPGASQGKKGLPVVGASVYVEHPTFEVLTLSYDLRRGAGVQRWRPGLPPPVDLLSHVASGGLVSGWNAAGFEMKVWRHCVERYFWPPLPLSQVRDSMAAARAFCYPGALGKAGEVMGLKQQKNADGKRLLDKFSIPRNPTKPNAALRIRPEDDPVDAEKLYAYCDEDVLTEQEAASLIPPLSPKELAAWQTDRAINDRGVQIDLEGVHNCIAIINQAHARYNAELRALTGGTVDRASELAKLQGWLGGLGVPMASMDEDALNTALAGELPLAARRALEIRQAVGSASVKKVFTMANMVSRDGRLRDLFLYHGTRTGRCIAEGQMVAVQDERGRVFETPIEDVQPSDLLWDGAGWVRHGGVVPQGTQEVITYDGVTATPDHLVFVSTNEYAKLSEVAEKQILIFRGELPCPTTFTD